MLILEHAIEDSVSAPEKWEPWGLEAEIKSMVKRLLQLDHQAWMDRLTTSGFTDDQVVTLDVAVHEWIGKLAWDNLTESLANQDLENESQVETSVIDWAGHALQDMLLVRFRGDHEWPSRFDALCYAASRLNQMINSTVEFERMLKEPDASTETAKSLTPKQRAAQKSWAEAGLAEDVQSWPRY